MSVHAPKSWDLYGSDTGPKPHIESVTSNYMSSGYDMSYFSNIVYPSNNEEVFENIFSETEFNTENQISKSFVRDNGLSTTTSVIDSRFAVGLQDFVIACYVTWDQMVATGGYNRGILSSIESGGGNGIGFSLFSDKICFWVGYGSVNTTVYSNITPEIGRVYHLIGIRRSGTLYFYIDGNLVGSGSGNFSIDKTKMVLYRDYANYDGFSGASKMKLYGLYFKQETRFITTPLTIRYASTLAQIISASSEYSTAYSAYKGITTTKNEYWSSSAVGIVEIRSGSQYLSMETVDAKIVRGYKITCYTASSAPKSWNILSSDDGVSWDVIDSRSNELDWYGGEERFYKIPYDNVVSSRFYRIQILDVVGDSYVSLKIFMDTSNWKLLDSVRNQGVWSVDEVRYFTPDLKTPCRWFMFNILESDKLGSYMLIKNIDLLKKSDVFDSIVPPVPSKLVTIGSANFSSLYNVFDDNETNYWVGSYPSGENHLPLYINLDGSNILNILEVGVSSSFRPTNILVYGSNDGYEYTQIGGQTLPYNLGYVNNELVVDMSSNTKQYSRYLLKFFGDPTDIRISRVVMKSVSIGSESGMKILTEVHPNDKIIMKYIGKS